VSEREDLERDEAGRLWATEVVKTPWGPDVHHICFGQDPEGDDKPAEDAPKVAPHAFERVGWRVWLCRHCFGPRSLHPRTAWVRARPLGDHTYLSLDAPHFDEGW
jgi:hypothetical protein